MAAKSQRLRCVGVDVSAKELHLAAEGREAAVFSNDPGGHKQLGAYITKGNHSANVVLEATGTYHVDLACFLANRSRCQVMVANPRATAHFHNAQGIRAKTDKVDAASLLEFAKRMPFVPWQSPSDEEMALRSAARFVDQLVKDRTRVANRIHAATTTKTTPSWVLEQLDLQYEQMTDLIDAGKAELISMTKATPKLDTAVTCLDSIPGIGEATAARLVAEFLCVPTDMNAKQITAWSGLDPRPRESGTSVRGRRQISKRGNARVRRLLYMPAITASRNAGPFKDLKDRVAERSGVKMVGVGAVMRKLLVVSWALFKKNEVWDSSHHTPKKVTEVG